MRRASLPTHNIKPKRFTRKPFSLTGRLVRAAVAAELLGVSARTMIRWLKEKRFPGGKSPLTGAWMVRWADLNDLLTGVWLGPPGVFGSPFEAGQAPTAEELEREAAVRRAMPESLQRRSA